MDTRLYLSSSLRQIERLHADLPLMERAGLAAAEWAVELVGDQTCPILILAGPGNNGGDAFVAARILRERFFDVQLVFASDPSRLPSDAAAARTAWLAAGGSEQKEIPARRRWGLIIDGIFGIGLTRPPSDTFAEWIVQARQLSQRDACPLLALDCPSGLNADTGQRPGPCMTATHTLSFIAGKPGLLTAEGPDHCGCLRVASLGLSLDTVADGHLLDRSDFAGYLRRRKQNTHKGSFGGVGILGGSKSMTGAALLAGRAALKLGGGRVYLGLLDADAPTVDMLQPELMIRRVDTLFQADLQALVCGPGLGRSADALSYLEQALKSPLPLVLDADALNLLAADGRLEGNLYNRLAPALLTPHPAEAARLLGTSVRAIQDDRITAACEMARRYANPVALKGCGTVIASPEGHWWINTTGNPGMASAGMGDVLSGLIATLLAQNWPPLAALQCAVHLHGAAADCLVTAGIGPVGLTAGEVIDAARAEFNRWL